MHFRLFVLGQVPGGPGALVEVLRRLQELQDGRKIGFGLARTDRNVLQLARLSKTQFSLSLLIRPRRVLGIQLAVFCKNAHR